MRHYENNVSDCGSHGGNNRQQIGIKCDFYFYNDVDAVQRD